MKTFIQSCIVALFVLAMSLPAQAITGNKILEYCKKKEVTKDSNIVDFQNDASCRGFIVGAVDGMHYFNLYLNLQNKFCFPKGVTSGQIRKVVVKYLEDNPQRLHEYYVPIIFSAMKEAFPCKE